MMFALTETARGCEMVRSSLARNAWAAPLLLLRSCSSQAFVTQGLRASPARDFRGKSPADPRSLSTHISTVCSGVALRTSGRTTLGRGRQITRSLQMAAASDSSKTSVLFVCLGNICRSPTAEAVFKQVTSKAGEADNFIIDSCGTGGGAPDWYKEGGESYHEGSSPDDRMTAAAKKRGIELTGGSRPLKAKDLEDFDLIIGMDAMNSDAIARAADYWGCSDIAAAKTRTMTSYCRTSGDVKSVPDPYYGGPEVISTMISYGRVAGCRMHIVQPVSGVVVKEVEDDGFEKVLDLLDDACEGLLAKCREGEA